MKPISIIEAIKDPKLFRPFLGDDLSTWQNWMVLLRAFYGLPIKSARSKQFFMQATGRRADLLPSEGFNQMLGLCSRRSGKSRVTAICAAFEASLAGRWNRCAAGEVPVVAVMAPRKQTSQLIKNYLRSVYEAPLLKNEIVAETREGFSLRNGVEVRIYAGDGGVAIRGTTTIAICIDEVAFFGVEEEQHSKNDTELLRACLPSLATTGGKLIAISSPYARRGWAYEEHARAFGNDAAKDILVVNGPSRLFNPTLPQSLVDAAIARDLQGAKSEWLGEFRDSVAAFIGRDAVEDCVVPGRKELMSQPDRRYFATVDMSGGLHDAACLCIGHLTNGVLVVDVLHHFPAPHEPHAVVRRMATTLQKFGIRQVTGDRFGGSWVSDSFREVGIKYQPSEFSASEAYSELLPRITTPGALKLLDHEILINELCNLERRVRPNGADLISHPPGLGHHDDAAVVVALLVTVTSKKTHRVGGLTPSL